MRYTVLVSAQVFMFLRPSTAAEPEERRMSDGGVVVFIGVVVEQDMARE